MLLRKCNCRLLLWNAFQILNVQGLFCITLKNWNWIWKKVIFLVLVNGRELIFSQRSWGDWLFILFFFSSTVLVRVGWLENECKNENIFLVWIFPSFINSFETDIHQKKKKDSSSEIQIFSHANNSKFSTHRQTNRQIAFFCHDFLWMFFSFMERKKDSKSGVSLVS